MSNMKILFHAYNTYCQNSNGGVQIRLNKIKQLLESRGIKCDYFSPSITKLEDYDILHIFTTNAENFGLVKAAKAKGCKIIVSSTLNLWDSKKIWLYTHFLNKLPILNVYKMSKNILDDADKIIAETKKEEYFIAHNYCISIDKLQVIPNGVDLFLTNDKCIYDFVPKGKPYILCVGRFDRNKNQLSLIKAIKSLELNVVFIGSPHFTNDGKAYYQSCLEAAKDNSNIFFLGWVDSKSNLLQSAYANAELLVLPSFDETFGITLLEGGIAGAKLSFSKTLPIGEYSCFSECRKFDPRNIADIKRNVSLALTDLKNSRLKEEIRKTFSWDNIIKKYIDIYEEVLNHD